MWTDGTVAAMYNNIENWQYCKGDVDITTIYAYI